ncbi:flagellar biosynthetic protein FliO [Dethiothermospora halolimnae]|uniref:flagellar biosynthetic protein FliO n=1 Tax=Dethiothermospora halolimnae TaxID=3114390 RepID=UPI003CCBADA1
MEVRFLAMSNIVESLYSKGFKLPLLGLIQGSKGTLDSPLIKLVFYLLAFVLVLLIAFYGTKFFAKKMSGLGNQSYMKIIDAFNIDKNTKILIVDILDNFYILSVGSNGTTVIDKVNKVNLDKVNNKVNNDKIKNNDLTTEKIRKKILNVSTKMNNITEKQKFNSKEEYYEEDQ